MTTIENIHCPVCDALIKEQDNMIEALQRNFPLAAEFLRKRKEARKGLKL